MIVLGAVLPHPPILLPEIGNGRESQAQATLDAYQEIGQRLRDLNVQRLVLISTHGIVTLQRFHVLTGDLSGNFARFQANKLTFERGSDQDLTSAIVDSAAVHDVPLTATSHWEESDHSIGVPLRLLGDAIPSRIAVVSISFRSPQDHYRLGQAIGETLSAIPQSTAIIASGDAVHTLTEDSQYGRHPEAEFVQQQYETALTQWDRESLFAVDESLRREVDESVVSPTLILMGALDQARSLTPNPRILVSEHPWGVGYVTSLVELAELADRPDESA